MRYWQKRSVQGSPKVRVVASCFLNSPMKFNATVCFIYSMLSQTYENFEVFIVHDGPIADASYRDQLQEISSKNPRIKLFETEQNLGKWGYPHRRKYALLDQDFDWVVITNSDNYYMPVFLEALLAEGNNPEVKFVYTNMVHSHKHWQMFNTQPAIFCIDMGAFMVTKEVINAIDFNLSGDCFAADGQFVNAVMSKFPNAAKKVDPILYVHN